MIQKPILFICCIALLFSDMAVAAEKTIGRNRATEQRVALVIGNGAYASGQRLKNPPNDAAGMARALRDLGFDVTERTNLTADAMNEEIFAFGSRLRSNGGVGLFYFSGHGVQYEGRNYLVPVGANIQREKQLKFRAIDAGSVLDEMEDARNGMNIMILDACRNNPFAGKFKSYGRSGLASMDAPVGTVIAYATGPEKTASEGPGRYSLYTHELIRQMKVPGQRLVDMFNGIRRKLKSRTEGKQIPWESTSLEWPFYFNPSGMVADGSAVIVEPSSEERSGGLKVKTTPSGATVWVDGARVGRSPVTLRGLNPGQVRVRAVLKGYRDKEERVSVDRGILTQVNLYLDRTITSTTTRPATTTTIPSQPGQWRDPVTGMDFVFVKGGCYEMGCGSWGGSCESDEKPVHTVCLDDFYMGRHEVTLGQWKQFVSESGYRGDGENYWKCKGMAKPDGYSQDDSHPVACVSWKEATAFAKWLSRKTGQTFRLPTEAEWEYACRSGGKPEKYCGGDNVDRVAWYSGNSGGSTHSVGTKAPNGLGIYDMSGNVYEWCEDVYAKDAYGEHRRNNPIYIGSGSYRVLRGGSWFDHAWNCRSAYRYWITPDYRFRIIGLRLAFSPRSAVSQ